MCNRLQARSHLFSQLYRGLGIEVQLSEVQLAVHQTTGTHTPVQLAVQSFRHRGLVVRGLVRYAIDYRHAHDNTCLVSCIEVQLSEVQLTEVQLSEVQLDVQRFNQQRFSQLYRGLISRGLLRCMEVQLAEVWLALQGFRCQRFSQLYRGLVSSGFPIRPQNI